MPNPPKVSKNISPRRTITTNRATLNKHTKPIAKNIPVTTSKNAHKSLVKNALPVVSSVKNAVPVGSPVKSVVPVGSPVKSAVPVRSVVPKKVAVAPPIIKGVVVNGNTQIKKIKPDSAVKSTAVKSSPTAVKSSPTAAVKSTAATGGGLTTGKKAIFKTAFRKPVDESKVDAPVYTQLRTDRPPVCYYAKQGPRDYMEDTYQIMHFEIQMSGTAGKKNGTFYGVFDGHGGKDVSYECVHMTRGIFPFLIEKIKKHEIKNIPQLIKSAFLEYDTMLFKRDLNAGSTAVIILYFDNKMYLINLGDSRGMIFTKDELIAVSDDHKPQKPREKLRIYKAGHFVNPFRIFNQKNTGKRFTIGDVYVDRPAGKQFIYLNGNWESITAEELRQIEDMTQDANEDTTRVSNSLALSRALGDFYLKVDSSGKYMGPEAAVSMIPDVTEIDVKKYQGQEIYIFLASDGFWDVNRNTNNLRKLMTEHTEPQKLCQEMVDSSYDKGSQDNTTVVLDRIKIL